VPRPTNVSAQTLRVLAQLLKQRNGWHYGYALARQTGLPSGTLYPILIRLAQQGWLETKWTEPDRPGVPPRHTYRLTNAGARAAAERIGSRPQALRIAPARTVRI
jgi:PadR family transcriptional regulator, regulatory protein PadR